MADRQHNVELIQKLQQSWSDPDPETFVSLFRPDGVFQDIPYGISLTGHDELRAHATRMKKHSRDLNVRISYSDATLETGVAEWELTHLFSGRFDGVDCADAPVAIRGLSMYIFTDGLISRAVDYWDYMEIVRSVGVIPRELRGLRRAADWND